MVDASGLRNVLQYAATHDGGRMLPALVRALMKCSGKVKICPQDFAAWSSPRGKPPRALYARDVIFAQAQDFLYCDSEEAMEKRVRWAGKAGCFYRACFETSRGAADPDCFGGRALRKHNRELQVWRHWREQVKKEYRGKRMARMLAWRKMASGRRDVSIRVSFA